MEYGDFEITILVDDGKYKARVTRFDGRHFSLAGTDHPHMLHAHADTALSYETEEEAVTEAKLIADAGRP